MATYEMDADSPAEGSVTILLRRLKSGDATGAEAIWRRYMDALNDVARRRLSTCAPAMAEAEVAANEALLNLLNGIQKNRFPRLDDREDLWKILVTLTDRRARDILRATRRRLNHERTPDGDMTIEGLTICAPTPAYVVELRDELQYRLEQLSNDKLRQVAIARLSGRSNAEIAADLKCSVKTVEKKLALIRAEWLRGTVD